jgi:hypothetical protein
MEAAIFIWACSSKRCKAYQSLYQSRMLRATALAFTVVFLMPSAAPARSKHCTFRVHAQANENDGSVFATPVTAPITGKNIFIEKIPAISERDVAAFRAYPAADGSAGVLVQLNDHGRLALETLSVEHRGTTVLVLINGRAVTELMIDRQITDGKVYVPSGLMAEDVAVMMKDWPLIGASKRR